MGSERKQKTYYIRQPGYQRRATFAIYEKGPDGEKSLKLESLDAINHQLKRQTITLEEAHLKVKELLFNLQKSKKSWNQKNIELLEVYWQDRYENEDKQLKRPEAAKWRIKQAIMALDELSLLSASKEQISEKIRDHPEQRRLASTLNSILKWAKRDIVLIRKKKKKRSKVRYITLEELPQLLPVLKSPTFRLLCETSFATGARLGECFSIDPLKLVTYKNKVYINILDQILKSGEADETKTGGVRRAPVISELADKVKDWSQASGTDKMKIRKLRHGKIVRNACKEIWPDQPNKWLRFHDFRHCYAIHLLSKGATFAQVAGALGDSIEVVQEHYTGFELGDASLEAILSIV